MTDSVGGEIIRGGVVNTSQFISVCKLIVRLKGFKDWNNGNECSGREREL